MMHDRNRSRLTAGLELLATQNDAVSPPADLEARVLREVAAAVRRSRQGHRLWLRLAAWSALAIVALLLLNGPGIPHRKQTPKHTKPFIQIPYVAPPAPYERLTVVRREVPVAALIAAGLRIQAPDAGASLRTEVLVGQDGRPMAIRLASGPNSN